MKKKALLIAGLTLFAAPLVSADAPQQRTRSHEARPAMEPITQAQWIERSETRFQRLDQNNDGRVTAEEMRASCEARVQHQSQNRNQDKRGDRFARMDRDGDGRISREEASRMPDARFQALDANSDGFLSKDELAARRGGPERRGSCDRAGGFLKKLDQDGDGVVTRAEARAASIAHFEKMDKNSDGVLTRDEMRHGKKGMHGKKGKRGERGQRGPGAQKPAR